MSIFDFISQSSQGSVYTVSTVISAIVLTLGFKRYYIKRASDTTDRAKLSEDERSFRQTVMDRLDKETARSDQMDITITSLRIELGSVKMERDAAVRRANAAETRADAAATKATRLQSRVEQLEETVKELKDKLAAKA